MSAAIVLHGNFQLSVIFNYLNASTSSGVSGILAFFSFGVTAPVSAAVIITLSIFLFLLSISFFTESVISTTSTGQLSECRCMSCPKCFLKIWFEYFMAPWTDIRNSLEVKVGYPDSIRNR